MTTTMADNEGGKGASQMAWIAGVMLAICVIYGFHARFMATTRTIVDHPIRADAADYFFYAQNLRHWGVYSHQPSSQTPPLPDTLRSPGFPFFASLFVTADPAQTVQHVVIAQTILQVITFLLLTWAFVRLLGVYWSLPAVAVLWTFPHFISINTYFLSESLFASCLAALMFLVWRFRQGDFVSDVGALLCGLVVGYASLVRPVLEYFPYFFLVLSLLIFRRRGRQYWLLAVAAVLPVLAWKVRNLVSTGAWSDPTLMLNGLYHGSFPNFMYQNDPASFGFPYRFDPRANEVYTGLGATLHLIWDRFLAHPLEYLHWYLVGKQTFLWQWGIIAGQGDIFIYPTPVSPYFNMPDMRLVHNVHQSIHGVWVVIGLLAPLLIGYRYWNHRQDDTMVWFVLAALVVYAMLIHAVVAPFPRYGIPFKLLLIPMSLYVIREFSVWIKMRAALRSQ